jgi:hypothetical protein
VLGAIVLVAGSGPARRHRRAHPPLQQVTQGLSVVKIGILLAPWHRRPGPG